MEIKRKIDWTNEEEYTLIEATQAAGDIVRDTVQSAEMNNKKKRLWNDVMKKINSIHGNKQAVKEVKKKWTVSKVPQKPVWIAAVGKRGGQNEGQMSRRSGRRRNLDPKLGYRSVHICNRESIKDTYEYASIHWNKREFSYKIENA